MSLRRSCAGVSWNAPEWAGDGHKMDTSPGPEVQQLLDHLIRPHQDRWRDRQPQRLRRLQSGRGLAQSSVGSPWLYPPFPASCPCRFAVSCFQPPPPQTRRADFRHRAYLVASRHGLCGLSAGSTFRPGSGTALGSLRTGRAGHRATPYSTSSSRSPDDSSPASGGAAPSARPTASQRQSTGSHARSGSS